MANFEYLHIWISAAEDVDDEGEVPYLYESVQDELNRLGEQGWELVNMTPHWEWTYDTIEVDTYESGSPAEYGPEESAEAPYSIPDYIRGWYCTFKRPSG